MKLTGAQLVAEVLLDHDVDTVFGYPGGAALNIYDALYQYQDRITHIMTAHEQGAAHAADGYARATGKTGVVIATSGPGATNLVTGIATAFMDSTPMVAITANVADELIGRDAFQEIHITGITLPITKQNYFVNRIEDLEDALRNAFRVAGSGRKGPVLVDITKDVTAAVTEYVNKEPMELRAEKVIKSDDISDLVELINKAEKPLMYLGGGCIASEAWDQVRELSSKASIPSVHTLMAAGTVSGDDPLDIGLVGMHGSVAANRAVDQADMILTLGARFSDRVALNTEKWGKRAKIIQVDIDYSEMNKNIMVDKIYVGDIKEFLDQVLPYIEEKDHKEWLEDIERWKKNRREPEDNLKLKPVDVMETISDLTDEDTYYVTDVGQHQMWAAQYLKYRKPKKFITSGGLGTMGFGYGAAIGVQVSHPENRVVHITGDGSFHMNMNEACTAVSNNLPIITVIMNNKVLGMVYQWQTVFYGKRYSSTEPERKTDYVKVAEGFGGKGYRARTIDEFREVFKKALENEGPSWIECVIDRNEKVLPMIPSGMTVHDTILD